MNTHLNSSSLKRGTCTGLAVESIDPRVGPTEVEGHADGAPVCDGPAEEVGHSDGLPDRVGASDSVGTSEGLEDGSA